MLVLCSKVIRVLCVFLLCIGLIFNFIQLFQVVVAWLEQVFKFGVFLCISQFFYYFRVGFVGVVVHSFVVVYMIRFPSV